ncbi:hypothetical protein Srot_1030 [Segniliparus rotundus DSM 44985]|uniref:Uncharacterized protein n=1 Tax=Segniliparus rotundus (strain ATCC BAA-972 / CDC 1076 / CIP 108378 / DSM 44985 / JCM 13578) TaxID=640132 RepID=D6ZEX9_SEGRD|nr:hypothetical protein [Segniliparus rotundus]ADG97503.1 hypothetical protein Srot_1030 [Segniliparus rotundus DSM 44985]
MSAADSAPSLGDGVRVVVGGQTWDLPYSAYLSIEQALVPVSEIHEPRKARIKLDVASTPALLVMEFGGGNAMVRVTHAGFTVVHTVVKVLDNAHPGVWEIEVLTTGEWTRVEQA